MSAESAQVPLEPELRFDVADAAAPAAAACARCAAAIADTYFEANGAVVCPACKAALEAETTSGSAPGRLARAALYGFGAAVAGAALYYAIAAATGYEIGLVAIAVGWMVGRGVQLGSRARGGWGYQALAVGLTYLAIVSTYVPYIIDGFKDAQAPAVATAEVPAVPDTASVAAATSSGGDVFLAFALLLGIAMAAPFLAGFENLIGLLIIGFALWQAWTMNRRTIVAFTGPYALGAARTAADA